MVDHHSHWPKGESPEHLISQAIWCLENAFESDGTLSTGGNIERALDNLSALHFNLFQRPGQRQSQLVYGPSPRRSTPHNERDRLWKRRPLLWREDALGGCHGLDPMLLQLSPLFSYNILKGGPLLGSTIIQKRFFDNSAFELTRGHLKEQAVLFESGKYLPSTPFKSLSGKVIKDIKFEFSRSPISLLPTFPESHCKTIIAQGEVEEMKIKQSKAEEGEPREHYNNKDEELPNHDPSPPPYKDLDDSHEDEAVPLVISGEYDASNHPVSHAVIAYFHLSAVCLEILLMQLRRSLEEIYESRADGLPIELIELCHKFEVYHRLNRLPYTNSIWNLDHQLHRIEVFEVCDIGIAYRQKCICRKDTDLAIDGVLHGLDVYCPRNIPFQVEEIDEDMEGDSVKLEWKNKKTVRPPTPEDSKSSDGEDEEAKEAEAKEDEAKEEDPAIVQQREQEEKAETIAWSLKNITDMIGLQNVKDHVCKLRSIIKTAARQGTELKRERFGTIFLGNTGTGKTTVAKNYAIYLSESGVVSGNLMYDLTGTRLAHGGIEKAQKYIRALEKSGGGVFFVDEAHRLVSDNHRSGGLQVLDYLLDEVENSRGRIVFVLAGTEKGMQELMGGGNGNVSSLLPYVLHLKDFTDDELVQLLGGHIEKRFDGKMKVEGGLDGLYVRIAARRLGRNRGGNSFGNARAVENLFAQIWERQSTRLENKRLETAKAKAAEAANVVDLESDGEVKSAADAVAGEKATEQTLDEESVKEADPENAPEEAALETKHGQPGDENERQPEVKTTGTESKPDASEDSNKPVDSEAEDLDDYIFTKEDILGPSPTDAILESEAWKKLHRLTGLQKVKESIQSIVELAKTNYQRELEEKPLIQLTFNRLFLGQSGTGKTVVAKLYGQILAEIGVLSKGELIVRNPGDLLGAYIGWSEAKTRAALSAANGNVLVIDEAHMMYTGGDGAGDQSDRFRKAVVDTLVAEIQNVPGEDRCVLLLGYSDKMLEMLQNGNPGLARRFPIADAFWFEEFTMDQLESILRTKLEDNVVEATEEAIKVAMNVLDKARRRLNFGNGGEVENLITQAKTNYQTRISSIPVASRPATWTFEPQDFDPDFDRGRSATLNLRKLFSDVVGCESVVWKLEGYQRVSQAMKLKNIDSKGFIPTNFVFKGPPGTGKTTTARKIAQVYYDMGFLSEAIVVECSTSDLLGRCVGHSDQKTVKALERGLGKVLFIDEAYRLRDRDHHGFAAEVVAELVDCLTKPKFLGKIVVILAGYEAEMNALLKVNPGLASRFPEELIFPSMAPKHCLRVLKMRMEAASIAIPVVDNVESPEYGNLIHLLGLLSQTPHWGNARDVETLAKGLCRAVFMRIQAPGDELVCSSAIAAAAFERLLQERRARAVTVSTRV